MNDTHPAARQVHGAARGRLNRAMLRNIRTIVRIRLKAARERGLQERLADAITTFSGRMAFAYIHVLWFAAWIVVNTGRAGIAPFDPFPYGLLTMIVSLEAIFLSTFVLISQNRLSAAAEQRADLDLQMDLLTEHELTHALLMLDSIQKKLGVEGDGDAELAELEEEIDPEDVLTEIERLQMSGQESSDPRTPAKRSMGRKA